MTITRILDTEIHVGDVNTELGVIILSNGTPVDVSSASIKVIKAWKPVSETVVSWATGFKTNGTDGHLTYFTQAGDLDEAGLWKLQGHIQLPTGEWHTSKAEVRVSSILS
jgi:hypothetical protein